jgi:transketolase C-terminal domain/subunit
MGSDDANVYDEIAYLRVIDISCPRQLLAAMEWIAAGDKGLIYLRVPRMPAPVLYDEHYQFDFGKASWLKRPGSPVAALVSSGRGVHEALAAAALLEKEGLAVAVVDMPSIDITTMRELAESGLHILFAEHNNGYLANAFSRAMMYENVQINITRIHRISALKANGHRRYIHSGTYPQIIKALGLDAESLAVAVRQFGN